MPPTPTSGRKKSILLFLTVFLLIGLLVIAGIYNNHGGKSPAVVEAVAIRNAAAEETAQSGDTLSGNNGAASGEIKATVPGSRHTVTIGPVVCATADTSRHGLQVGIRLAYGGSALDSEIREKQENIERLVKFVFIKKQLAQINAETARAELLEKINAFLSSGRVDDLIFTAFDIIPMEIK